MKRYVVSIVIVLAVLIAAFSSGVLTDNAFGQDEEKASRAEQRQNIRQKWENMSEADREKFRAEMRESKQKWENMSDEERQKLRTQMRDRFDSRLEGVGRDAQLKSIKAVEVQVAKLKAAVEVTAPENQSRLRELSAEDRAKLREKMMAAMRERQLAIRAIEQELVKLKAPGIRAAEPRARISELRSIQKLAVKEKATQTAERLEKLIAAYQRESKGRMSPPAQRTRRDRPVRQEKTE